MEEAEIKRSLRTHLQISTHRVHKRVDGLVAGADLLHADGYCRFLASQLCARDAIEDWVDLHCPALLRPPSMSGLLREDLHEMGYDGKGSEHHAHGPFALPLAADPVGLAWTIAGSQMGNRAILAILKKEDVQFPRRFLSNREMSVFWRRLLPRLQEETDQTRAEPAISAALAVFQRFEEVFAQTSEERAAVS